MLTLLLGTDWTANRDRILSSVAKDVSEQKNGRILMVPELISHDTERRLCAVAGDTCSRFAEVLSFKRLASRVADSVGHAALSCMDNGGRVVAMAAAVQQLHSRLKSYASMETRPEFLTGLVDAVDEFKRCCISSGDLMSASRNTEGILAQKLEELSLILESYDCLCQQGKRDPRDQMTWLLEELEAGSFGQDHVFYVDGFPDFTRQHMAILLHLIQVSPNVTVSLTCDKPGSKAMAFEKAGQTAAELLRSAEALGVPVEIQVVAPREDALSGVRDSLFQGKIVPGLMRECLRVFRSETVHQECVAAVEEILRIVHDGGRYRDISVVCADLQTYRNTIQMAFRRSNIPAYISGTDDVLEKSVITTVLSAMDAALGGFEQQDVIRYLKSSLSPVDMDLCDKLENYAIMWGITGNRWLKTWTNHPGGLGQKPTQESELYLQQLNEARALGIDPLIRLSEGFQTATKVCEQVRALYDYFVDISLSQRLSALARELDDRGDNRSAQILNQLWDILMTALEQLYDVLGQNVWDPENFTRLFKLLLSQYDVGTIPPVLDTVTVGPVSAMRCQQCKHLIVLGAEEGVMPSYGGSAGVLTDQERTALREMGVPLTGGAMEGLQAEFAEIYGVFCGAEKSITISCPGSQPSVIYRRLRDMSGGDMAASAALGSALGSREEAGAYLVRHRCPEAADALGIGDVYARVKAKTEHDLGVVTRENVRKLYGNTLKLSASQIDRQAQCRLSYFLRYGIGAKERKQAQLDPAEFGTYVHAVLEETAKEIMTLGGFREVTMEQALEIADRHSSNYARECFSQIDTQRLTYLFRRNAHELSLIVQELWKEMQTCEFEPVGFEVGFGDGKEVPAIDVSGKEMAAQLRGFVDRVDAWRDGQNCYFRVVDYKTGKKDFDYCDIYNGYGLQMLLYLFALERGGKNVFGSNAIGAGVQYFPARVPLVSADGILSEEEAELAREKLWKRKGLLLSWENVLEAMENTECLKRLPVSRKKDGSLSGDLADRQQFALLQAYVFSVVGAMVDDIASGCVTPNPYCRGSSHDACAYCPYDAVCHKQDVEGRRNFKAISAERFWSDIEKEMSGNG